MKELLKKIKLIVEQEFKDSKFEDLEWDGSLSLTGVKNFIHCIWNEGYNSKGDNLVEEISKFSPKAAEMLQDLIKEYSILPKIEVKW